MNIDLPFQHLIGNDQIKTYCRTMFEQGLVGHSFLFAGRDGIGKGLFALEFARLLLAQEDETKAWKIQQGIHPDVHILRPVGKVAMHSFDSLKQF